jgi:hypothetical protein
MAFYLLCVSRTHGPRNREMSDLVFIVLTVAVFALFALVVKAVERL